MALVRLAPRSEGVRPERSSNLQLRTLLPDVNRKFLTGVKTGHRLKTGSDDGWFEDRKVPLADNGSLYRAA
jgi:hypothetical protein